MNINDRVKHVRKTLNLTQTEFGEPLALKQSAVGNIESGRNSVTERTVKAICKNYNVNEKWLKEGGNDSEMFCEISDSGVLAFAEGYGLDEFSQSILLAYVKMDEKKRTALITLLRELVGDPNTTPLEPQQESSFSEDLAKVEAREEAERYYQELLAEKRAKDESSALEDQQNA